MLEKFIYENHLGQRYVGTEYGVYLNYNDLRDYSWSYDTINSRISRFYRQLRSRKLPLTIVADTDEKAINAKNKLLEVAEADIAALLPGRIWIGDYYCTGYITASAKSNYLITDCYCTIDLTFVSENPVWHKDSVYVFPKESGDFIGQGSGTDYPYDYAYDYALSLRGRQIICDALGDSEFKLLIYGEVHNPAVTINGHTYAINGDLQKGEYLVIDSPQRTITLTTATGGKINWFDKRGRDDYIFTPISSGQNTVGWNGLFGFELTIIEERSEPRWT